MDAINYLTVIFFVGKLQEKVPLSYTFNGTSFMYLAFFLTAVNALSFNMNKSQTRTFFQLFHINKMHLLALWAFSQTKMTDFPTLLYTSTSEIPTLKPDRGTPFGRSLLVLAIIGSTPLLGLQASTLLAELHCHTFSPIASACWVRSSLIVFAFLTWYPLCWLLTIITMSFKAAENIGRK